MSRLLTRKLVMSMRMEELTQQMLFLCVDILQVDMA